MVMVFGAGLRMYFQLSYGDGEDVIFIDYVTLVSSLALSFSWSLIYYIIIINNDKWSKIRIQQEAVMVFFPEKRTIKGNKGNSTENLAVWSTSVTLWPRIDEGQNFIHIETWEHRIQIKHIIILYECKVNFKPCALY